MNPDFLVQFVINRLTGLNHILLTDTSTGLLTGKGNFKITYPDGSVSEYNDWNSPNISSLGSSFQAQLMDSSDGEVMMGGYVIEYTLLDTVNDLIGGNTKTFEFSFDEPELEIISTSDVAVPRVAFSVPFDFTNTDYTETLVTFDIQCQFPSTSDISFTTLNKSLTSGDRELLMVSTTNYYEGSYTPTVDFVATYQSVTYAFLSVSWTDQESNTILIYEMNTAQEILDQIEVFKSTESCDESEYNRVMALYSNIESSAREGSVDEGNSLLSELYEIIGINQSGSFQSGPIAGFTFSSNDLGNYYTRTEIDNLFATFSATLGLTEDIEVSVDGAGIGGFAFEEVALTGRTFTSMWRQLLRSSVAPTYNQPVIALAGSNFNTGNKVGEVGVAQTINLSPSFTQNDAGSATQFILDKDDSPIATDVSAPIPDASYPDSFTGVEGTIIYHGELDHAIGPVKNNSLGDPDPTGQIQAGTIITNDVQYDVVYPWFFGTSSDGIITGPDVYAGAKVIEVIGSSIQAAFSGSDVFFWFAVPSSNNNPKSYTSWADDNDANNAGSIGGATNLFGSSSTISVSSTGLDSDWTIDYDVYVTNYKTLAATFNLS